MPTPWCRTGSRTRLVRKPTGRSMWTANQSYPRRRSAGPGQIYRQPVHHQWTQRSSRVHNIQLVFGRFNRKLRANRGTQRSRPNRRHAGLHVLGSGMPFHKKHLYLQPNSCQGGVGAGARTYNIPTPDAAPATTVDVGTSGSNKSHVVPPAVVRGKMVGAGRFELLRTLASFYSRVSAALRRVLF